MRSLTFCLSLLLFSSAYAQDNTDADRTLQQAQAALKQAQAAVDAAVKAKQAADRAKGLSQPTTEVSDENIPVSHKKYLPIDVGLDIYTDGTVGASYSYNGRPLNGFQDFADVIHTMNDPKCNSLLDASSTEDALAWVSMAVGTGLITYYVIDVVNKAEASVNSTTDAGPDISADTPILIGGNLVFAAGTILFLASQGDFTHAINRYNRRVQKQNQISFYFDPNPNKPILGLVQRF